MKCMDYLTLRSEEPYRTDRLQAISRVVKQSRFGHNVEYLLDVNEKVWIRSRGGYHWLQLIPNRFSGFEFVMRLVAAVAPHGDVDRLVVSRLDLNVDVPLELGDLNMSLFVPRVRSIGRCKAIVFEHVLAGRLVELRITVSSTYYHGSRKGRRYTVYDWRKKHGGKAL